MNDDDFLELFQMHNSITSGLYQVILKQTNKIKELTDEREMIKDKIKATSEIIFEQDIHKSICKMIEELIGDKK